MTNRYAFGWCEHCGKVAYARKPLAKAAIKAFHRGERMSVYRCTWIAGAYHVGHLPRDVSEGRRSRSDIRNRPGWSR